MERTVVSIFSSSRAALRLAAQKPLPFSAAASLEPLMTWVRHSWPLQQTPTWALGQLEAREEEEASAGRESASRRPSEGCRSHPRSVRLPDGDVVMQEKTFLLRRCDAVGILVARRRPRVGVWCCKFGRIR